MVYVGKHQRKWLDRVDVQVMPVLHCPFTNQFDTEAYVEDHKMNWPDQG